MSNYRYDFFLYIISKVAYKEIELTKIKDHLKMAEEDIQRLEKENAVSFIDLVSRT